MKGQVLDFSIQTNSGVIASDDGRRYSFTGDGWQIPTPPQIGMPVDFDTNGGTAIDIYAATRNAPPSSTPAVLPPARTPAATVVQTRAGASPQDLERRGRVMSIIGIVIGIPTLFLFWIPVFGWTLMMVGLGLSIAGLVMAKQHGGSAGLAIGGIVLNAIPVTIYTAVAVTIFLIWKIITGTISTLLPFLKWIPF